jgi:mannose-6-phosphate isomerase
MQLIIIKLQAQKEYLKIENKSNEVVDCDYFTTNLFRLKEIILYKNQRFFYVYMCVDGEF